MLLDKIEKLARIILGPVLRPLVAATFGSMVNAREVDGSRRWLRRRRASLRRCRRAVLCEWRKAGS
jgi:hypothetical protein